MPRFSPDINTINRSVFSSKGCALVFFILFVFFSACKTALFDRVLVGSGSFPDINDLIPGFLNKFLVTSVAVVLLTRSKYRLPVIAFYVLQAVYMAVNTLYYLSFQGYLHISQYAGLFSEAFDLLTHAAVPWDPRSLFVGLDLPFFIAAMALYPRLAEVNKRFLFRPVLYTASVLFIFYFYKWEVPQDSPLEIMNNAYASDAAVVKDYGLLTFNIMDLVNFNDARSHIKKINYGPMVSAPDTAGPHPNVVVLQVESLDAYIIKCRYKGEYVMPFLRRLSDKCVFFPYMLSYHLAGSTSDCEFSTINSIEPFDNYPSIKIRNYDYPNSVLKRCMAEGYSVVAFHGNRGSYFNRNFAFKKMGFQKFYDMFGMHLPEMGWGASDESVLDFVKSEMARQKQPFFFYVITMSSHEPFIFVKPYYHKKSFDAISNGPVRNFFTSMSYVDKRLENFIPFIKQHFPNTVIFIYGDHTPTLPKCTYSKSMFEMYGRLFEFVPLFIITPEGEIYREQSYAASFLDIAPTILAAEHNKNPIRSHGLNLLSGIERDKDVPYGKRIYSRRSLFLKIAKNH